MLTNNELEATWKEADMAQCKSLSWFPAFAWNISENSGEAELRAVSVQVEILKEQFSVTILKG
jgi:hypothetical protein